MSVDRGRLLNQVGGSFGLALLSTLAATATRHYLAGKHPTPNVLDRAALHGYTTGFWWAADSSPPARS